MSSDGQYSSDPYLAFQPTFAYSLPIQLLVNGITLTLLMVLLIHILFTTQYHYPLAPLNFILQLCGVLVVLASVIAKVVIILQNCSKQGDYWPYNLDYVFISIPPDRWNMGKNAAWFVLQALNSGFANATHIQFLTLLFPSRTEARIIFFTLGPLALASSCLVFTSISSNRATLDLGDAIRNVFNSTLLLIFTAALFIWGFLVNRRRAWRFDGGTAVFGSGALGLALVGTVGNFIAVREDGIEWLQHLLWAAVLWQTWLGWWWWVGSGMGIGEVEDLVRRSERRKRRSARKSARASRVQAAQERQERDNSNPSQTGADNQGSVTSAIVGITSGVAGIWRASNPGSMRRRPTTSNSEHVQDEETGHAGGPVDDVERVTRPRVTVAENAVERSEAPRGPQSVTTGTPGSSTSTDSSTSRTPSLHPPGSIGSVLRYPATWLQVYMRKLKAAHEVAATKKAIERENVRARVFAGATLANPGTTPVNEEARRERRREQSRPRTGGAVDEGDGYGWGLGSFGLRAQQEGQQRVEEAGRQVRLDRLINRDADGQVEDEIEIETSTATGTDQPRGADDAEWVDANEEPRPPPPAPLANPTSSWSWWGPVREWRLADRSVF